jgi:hypothetical protein
VTWLLQFRLIMEGARPRTAHHLSDIRQHFMISSEYNKKFSEFSSLVNFEVSLREAGKSRWQCVVARHTFVRAVDATGIDHCHAFEAPAHFDRGVSGKTVTASLEPAPARLREPPSSGGSCFACEAEAFIGPAGHAADQQLGLEAETGEAEGSIVGAVAVRAGAIDDEQRIACPCRHTVRRHLAVRQVDRSWNMGFCEELRRAHIEENEIDFAGRKGGMHVGAIGFEGKLGGKVSDSGIRSCSRYLGNGA